MFTVLHSQKKWFFQKKSPHNNDLLPFFLCNNLPLNRKRTELWFFTVCAIADSKTKLARTHGLHSGLGKQVSTKVNDVCKMIVDLEVSSNGIILKTWKTIASNFPPQLASIFPLRYFNYVVTDVILIFCEHYLRRVCLLKLFEIWQSWSLTPNAKYDHRTAGFWASNCNKKEWGSLRKLQTHNLA